MMKKEDFDMEKEFKGTKGEWKVFDFKGEGPVIDIALGQELCAIAQVYSPIEMAYDEKQTLEHKANAQLIAAAPELLNASMAALRFMQKTGINYDNADIYNSLNSAINKALGKS